MSVKVDLESVKKMFEGMIERSKLTTGWLNRVAYPQLLNVQRLRWQTEGGSEGSPWVKTTDPYRTSKLKRYADYPGGGRKDLIATGRLAFSMTLDGSLNSAKASMNDHYKLVQENKLEMGSFVPYARFMQESGRDMTTLSPDTQTELAENLRDYIVNGTMKVKK